MPIKEPRSLADYEKDYFFVHNDKIIKGNIFSINYIGTEMVSVNILSGDNLFKVSKDNLYENPDEVILVANLIDRL